jgi:DNA-binding NarL/FixJ family response regulator
MQNLRQSLWSQNGRANKRRVSREGTFVATIRILLADDSEAILADLREELSKEFEIIGTAGNGEEAVQAVLHLDPDVLVIDIAMPVLNGIQASSRIRKIHPRTKILFLTINEQAEYISAAFSAGASGYVTKRRLASDLAQAIREVFLGNTFLSPSLGK